MFAQVVNKIEQLWKSLQEEWIINKFLLKN